MQSALASDNLRLSDWIATAANLETRHAHFVSADAGATRQRILEVSQGRCRFSVTDAGPFVQFKEAHAYAGRLAVKFLSWNCAAKCETSVARTAQHHVSLHIPLAGEFEARQGGQVVTARPGQLLVVSSPGVIRRRWEGPCDLLNVMIAREAKVVPGSSPASNVFPSLPLVLVDLRQEITLALFIENLVQDLGRENPSFSGPDALPQAERLLLALLAESLRRSDALPARHELSAVAPYYVRRAEDYIQQNYARKFRMGELARACGVSVRTLHYGFAKFRDHGPAERLRAVRLSHARQALIEARSGGDKVAEIAGRVGYANKSQFSRDYRERFGETPTATLRRVFD